MSPYTNTYPTGLAPDPPHAAARIGLGCLGMTLLALAGPPLWLALLPSLLGAGDPASAAVGGALGLIGLLFGLTLLSRALRGGSAERPRFGRRGAGWPLLLLPLVLLGGTAALMVGGAAIALLPLAHFLAALLPALAISALVARGVGGVRLHTVLASITWGGLAATSIAMVLEGIFLLLMVLVVSVGLQLDGGAALSRATAALQDLSTSVEDDPTAMLVAMKSLLGLPGVLVAGYGLFALLGPAIEELAKLGGVILAAPRTRHGALLRGVAVGAGFGLVETVLLGGSAFGAPIDATGGGPTMAAVSQAGWPAVMGMRAVTTAMHAACSGVAALGWYAMSEQRRWAAGALRIGVAILAHGMWNGLILTVIWNSLRLLGPDALPQPDAAPFAAVLAGVAMAGLIALAWTMILGLRAMARRVARSNHATGPAL